MSNVETEVETEDPETNTNDLRELREAAKRAKDNAAKAEASDRRAVMAEAGVPREGKIAGLFRDSYKGELTEEAVKTAWEQLQAEMGGLPIPDQEAETTAQVEDMTANRQGLGDPHVPQDPPKKAVIDEAMDAFEEERKKGRPNRDAAAQVSQRIIDAAVKGDADMLVRPYTREELDSAKASTQ